MLLSYLSSVSLLSYIKQDYQWLRLTLAHLAVRELFLNTALFRLALRRLPHIEREVPNTPPHPTTMARNISTLKLIAASMTKYPRSTDSF